MVAAHLIASLVPVFAELSPYRINKQETSQNVPVFGQWSCSTLAIMHIKLVSIFSLLYA